MVHLLQHLAPLSREVVSLGGCPHVLRRDEGAELDMFFGREFLVARELLPDPDERALQAAETLLEVKIPRPVLPMDRVQVGLVEDGPGRPALRDGAGLLEDPDMPPT